MVDYLSVVREILKESLQSGSLKGARLKPFVVMEFERRTGEKFARALYDFPRFSDLLMACHDVVEIDRSGATDIVVRLRSNGVTPTPKSAPTTYISPQPGIQGTLWHAFANPDTERRRFYHRKTGEVVHYLQDEPKDAEFARRVASDSDYVEIRPISRLDHSGWMKEFVYASPIPEGTRAALLSIAGLPYTSHVNRAFGAALEKYADGWRRFRTVKVLERVRQWAVDNSVAVPELLRSPVERGIKEAAQAVAAQGVAAATTPGTAGVSAETKKLLHLLVDALQEGELGQPPASVLSRIVNGHPQ